MSPTTDSATKPAVVCPFQGRLARRRLWIVILACAASLGLGALVGWLTDELAPAARSSANLPARAEAREAIELELKARVEEELLRTDD